LTEGWVAGLGKAIAEGQAELPYKIVGTYVETPLCWAISTGPNRKIDGAEELKGKKIGVSRIGRYARQIYGLPNLYTKFYLVVPTSWVTSLQTNTAGWQTPNSLLNPLS